MIGFSLLTPLSYTWLPITTTFLDYLSPPSFSNLFHNMIGFSLLTPIRYKASLYYGQPNLQSLHLNLTSQQYGLSLFRQLLRYFLSVRIVVSLQGLIALIYHDRFWDHPLALLACSLPCALPALMLCMMWGLNWCQCLIHPTFMGG